MTTHALIAITRTPAGRPDRTCIASGLSEREATHLRNRALKRLDEGYYAGDVTGFELSGELEPPMDPPTYQQEALL